MTEDDPIADAAIAAILPLAARDGWTTATLRAGLRAAGRDPVEAASEFPAGPVGAIGAWAAQVDRAMARQAVAEALDTQRIPARIRRLVEIRLRLLAPHKRALRRAAARLALPWATPAALRIAARTADAIWTAAGDTSTDFSRHTRRASLGAIYAATIAYWLRDDDPSVDDALAFLDRRLGELARLQRRRPKPAAA